MGGDFTAKGFRTWHATLHAVELLHRFPLPESHGRASLERCINAVVGEVAAGLRNTPAVCRKSYINPAVFLAWRNGELHHRSGRAPSAARAAPTLRALLARERRGRKKNS